MYLSPNEAYLLECSILQYFIWRQEANPMEAIDDDTTSVDTSASSSICANHSSICANHLSNRYNRMIQVLKEDLPNVAMLDTPALSSSTPDVCFRWLYNLKVHNNILDDDSISHKKRKRDMADEIANPKYISEDAITLENAKEFISNLRDEHTEVKKITDSLELKLSKSEKIYSGLLRIHKEKLRLEKKLENLESEEAKAEQTFDNQHVKDIDEGKADQSHLREKLETKKRRVELQEAIYANAILNEVHETESQSETKNMNHEMSFERKLQELIRFKEEFGHCQVGREKHRTLSLWLTKQRQYYRLKKPSLSAERIAKLDALGVLWDADHCHKRKFDEYAEMCREFKEAHGHLRIPLITERNGDGTEPTEDDVCFRIWAQSMRRQYQGTPSGRMGLDKRRIAILDSIGFQWSIDATSVEGGNIDVEKQDPRETLFRTRIDQLRTVKEICGNCNEKKHIVSVFPNSKSLLCWMRTQRKEMKFWLSGKKTRLTEERIEMLRSIEFDHDPRKHYTPSPYRKKKMTRMELLALELKERKNNQDSDDASEYDNSDMDV